MRGVGSLIHYPIPPHLQQAYATVGRRTGAFPLAERMADQVLSLPMGPAMGEAELTGAVRAVQSAAKAICHP